MAYYMSCSHGVKQESFPQHTAVLCTPRMVERLLGVVLAARM